MVRQDVADALAVERLNEIHDVAAGMPNACRTPRAARYRATKVAVSMAGLPSERRQRIYYVKASELRCGSSPEAGRAPW
jgi:hypothetical protein